MRLLAIILLLVPSLALGQDAGDLQRRWSLLEAHRSRLESLLSTQVKRISRLKVQRPGVRRDYQLKTALRDNRELASKLTQLQEQIRELNRRLVAAYDSALAQTRDPAQRAALRARRDELARKVSASSGRIVTGGRANPLDSAEDLEEKADLLKDSEEKVRRQLGLIRGQIVRLQRRAKLRRHSRAVDDSPFIEDSPRRLAKTGTGSSSTSRQEADSPHDPASPTGEGPQSSPPPAGALTTNKTSDDLDAAATPGGSWYGASGGGSELTSRPDLNLSIRGVMDPSMLKELQHASKSGSVKERIAALQKAQKRLEQMARKLDGQAKSLRKRAKSIK